MYKLMNKSTNTKPSFYWGAPLKQLVKVHYLNWWKKRGINKPKLENGRGKPVHHSRVKCSRGSIMDQVLMCISAECVYVCVFFAEQSACLPAEQPRLCMNRAAYQLTFKLEPQSDCRPKGWRSYLIGCCASDLLTIEINRARWAYPQAAEVWRRGR